VDSEAFLDGKRKIIRRFETSKARLEAQVVQLSRKLQKSIKSNSLLTQDGWVELLNDNWTGKSNRHDSSVAVGSKLLLGNGGGGEVQARGVYVHAEIQDFVMHFMY
jgi:hypothetical protein